MTMHKTLYPRDNIDRQYVSRKEEESGQTSTEDSIDISILEDTRRSNKKERRKTDYSYWKKHKQHKD